MSSAAIRKWRERERDPSFRDVEQRVRMMGERPDPAPDQPDLGEIAEHRARYDRSMKVCTDIGPGPWKCTRAMREINTGAYTDNRSAALESIAALRALGVTERLPEPPPLNPYPRDRRRRYVSFWGPKEETYP